MVAAILDRDSGVMEASGELIGPYAPPSGDEILARIAELDPESKVQTLRALGKAAVEINQEALKLSRRSENNDGTAIPVSVPASIGDARIINVPEIHRMALDRKQAGRMLSRDPKDLLLRSIVKL